MSIVPLVIRPHLVPFFFKESDGKEASTQDVAVGEFYIESTTGYLRQRLT